MVIIISKRSVDALKPSSRDTIHWDAKLRGFGVKLTPAGSRIYIVQYRLAGRLRRLTLGRHGSPWTPEEARKEAIRLLGKVASGGNPANEKAAARQGIPFAALASRFLEEHAATKKKPRSAYEDARLLQKLVLPKLGTRLLTDISQEDVARLHHDLRETPYQANRVLALLSKMFGLAERWGLRPEQSNPCRFLQKYKEKSRQRFLTERELGRLQTVLSAAESSAAESAIALNALRLLLLTGARLNEIFTAKWAYVDEGRQYLLLPDSKTGKRPIHLSTPALSLLRHTPRILGNPYIFPGAKPGKHFVGLPKVWGRIRQVAQLPGVRIHDLRHTFASVAASGGASLLIIGKLLGLLNPLTTARYAHLASSPVHAASERIAASIEEAMQPRAESKNLGDYA